VLCVMLIRCQACVCVCDVSVNASSAKHPDAAEMPLAWCSGGPRITFITVLCICVCDALNPYSLHNVPLYMMKHLSASSYAVFLEAFGCVSAAQAVIVNIM